MKSKTLLALLIIILQNCSTIKDANGFLEQKIDDTLLKSDVDEVNSELQKFHPQLYRYITKEKLDFKFDSLKNSINKPLTPAEFFFKLAPVISEIKEGHLRVRIPSKKYTKKEINLFKSKTPLLGQLSYKIIDEKLYIADVFNKKLDVVVGDEILTIGSHEVRDLISKYRTIIYGDGDNKTFYKHAINKQFLQLLRLEYGLLNDVSIKVKTNSGIKVIKLERKLKSQQTELKPIYSKAESKMYDYNISNHTYNRTMKFLKADSTIAYMKIKKFSQQHASKFYNYSFNKIKNAKTQYLIIDIRDNPGGSLTEINNFYSYIAKEDFTLIKTPVMSFKNASLYRNYFNGLTIAGQAAATIVYPGFLLGNLLMNKEGNDGTYYYKQRASKFTNINKNSFKGKIYLLINGASFSASAILAAKFKDDKLGIIVGEETGGAKDGTVAGFYNTIQLKNSKLKIPIGLLLIQPNIHFENNNRGVMPDVTINYNPFNFNDKKDLELEWVLNDIQKNTD